MKFHTFGNPANKTVILIHGMLNPWQLWQKAADAFSEEYFVIVPELDAHTEEESSRFESVENEAEQIRDYFLKISNGRLYAICGLSMGGRIAAVLASLPDISAEYLVLDGAPLLPMPKLLVSIMQKSYLNIIRKSKQRDPKILESFKRDFLPEKYFENYLKIADNMDERSIYNILSSVFSKFEFQKLDGCKILSMHGTKGNEFISKKATIKMKAVNPQTEIRCFNGYAHAQLMCFEPEKWISEVRSFFLS